MVFSISKGLGNSVCGHRSRISRIDNIGQHLGKNYVCGHRHRISTRLTLTLHLLYGVYNANFTLYLLYGVLVLKGSDSELFFACVGLWKELIRWSRSKNAYGISSSRYDASIDSLEKLQGIAHRCTREVRGRGMEAFLDAIGALETQC